MLLCKTHASNAVVVCFAQQVTPVPDAVVVCKTHAADAVVVYPAQQMTPVAAAVVAWCCSTKHMRLMLLLSGAALVLCPASLSRSLGFNHNDFAVWHTCRSVWPTDIQLQ